MSNNPHEVPAGDWRLGLRTGDRVVVRKDDGREDEHVLRSDPWQLRHGTWVVLLTRITGGYSLARVVRAVEPGSP